MLCLALAAPAGAQSAGNGLYEPFPSAASRERAKRFVDDLRPGAPRVSSAQLDRGLFLGAELRPAVARAATGRAIPAGGTGGTIGWWLAPALLAICAVPLLAGGARRRG